jgi:hypothetical protein
MIDSSKEYPIDLGVSYIIPTGNVAHEGRVPDFLVTPKDLDFLTGIVTHITKGVVINNDDVSMGKISKVLPLIVDAINIMFNTDVMNNNWKEFDGWVSDFKNKCYNDRDKYGCADSDKTCVTSVSAVPYFLGDCREHEVLLHLMLKLWMRDNRIDDVQIRSLYARYHYPTSLSVEPDYDHTHPILIHSGSVYWIDALDYKFTEIKLGSWAPLEIESNGDKNHIKWNYDNKDKSLHVFGHVQPWSNNKVKDYIVNENTVFFYGDMCNKALCMYDVDKLMASINEDTYFEEKLKRITTQCMPMSGGRVRQHNLQKDGSSTHPSRARTRCGARRPAAQRRAS